MTMWYMLQNCFEIKVFLNFFVKTKIFNQNDINGLARTHRENILLCIVYFNFIHIYNSLPVNTTIIVHIMWSLNSVHMFFFLFFLYKDIIDLFTCDDDIYTRKLIWSLYELTTLIYHPCHWLSYNVSCNKHFFEVILFCMIKVLRLHYCRMF